jgi:hypothetical protein
MSSRWRLMLPFPLLAACAEPPQPDVAPDTFGLAVRQNFEAQIEAPDRKIETLAPSPGVRRSLAVERYQADQVDAPIEIYTREQ